MDVNVSPCEDTVWLNRNQIASLFGRDVKTIGKHVNTILKEEFKDEPLVVANFATTATDGKIYKMKYYNLDVILSVGYRVNSKRGILFRKWANQILKQYLFTGYSIQEKRCLECQDNLISLNSKVNTLLQHDLEHNQILNELTKKEVIFSDKLFYENEIFEAYSFIKQLSHKAQNSITIIDGYMELSVLDMLKDIRVPIFVYTYPSAKLSKRDIEAFNLEHNITLIRTNQIHDGFLIIDETIYVVGASIKDAGKKRFIVNRISDISKETLLKGIKE